jgi:hypothetical protein
VQTLLQNKPSIQEDGPIEGTSKAESKTSEKDKVEQGYSNEFPPCTGIAASAHFGSQLEEWVCKPWACARLIEKEASLVQSLLKSWRWWTVNKLMLQQVMASWLDGVRQTGKADGTIFSFASMRHARSKVVQRPKDGVGCCLQVKEPIGCTPWPEASSEDWSVTVR